MDAEELLRSLGATGKLKGFFYAVYMVERVQKDPMATSLITKCLYPEVAKHFGISPGAVERNLRTVIKAVYVKRNYEIEIAFNVSFEEFQAIYLEPENEDEGSGATLLALTEKPGQTAKTA